MPDALELALANAASNMPKGEELHIENLDSIATGDASMNPPSYEAKMKDAYRKLSIPSNASILPDDTDDHNFSLIHAKLVQLVNQGELTKLRLDALADMISEVSTTISKAAQSMPQEPDHKHRSLHEWDDQYLINELVERENDLMPFYYELLKRIGSPELQSLVMSSMQGKNNSMVTLAQLCAALGAATTQSQSHVQAQSIPETGHQRLEQMNPLEQQQFAQQMNTVIPKSTYFETPPTYNPYFKER